MFSFLIQLLAPPFTEILAESLDRKYTKSTVELLNWVVKDILGFVEFVRVFGLRLRICRCPRIWRYQDVCETFLDCGIRSTSVSD